jgi:hypothetical protein
MSPSTAMTAGLLVLPAAKGELFVKVGGVDCGCSLGAMCVGYGSSKTPTKASVEKIVGDGLRSLDIPGMSSLVKAAAAAFVKPWQELRPCPVKGCGEPPDWAGSMCGHLEDRHGWRREQLRDWLVTQGL